MTYVVLSDTLLSAVHVFTHHLCMYFWHLYDLYHSCQLSRSRQDTHDLQVAFPVPPDRYFHQWLVPLQRQMGPKPSILSNFGPHISIFSGRGSTRSPKVDQKWAWSVKFRAHYIYFPPSFLIKLATMLYYFWPCMILSSWYSSQ
jgi:hypothetical protein